MNRTDLKNIYEKTNKKYQKADERCHTALGKLNSIMANYEVGIRGSIEERMAELMSKAGEYNRLQAICAYAEYKSELGYLMGISASTESMMTYVDDLEDNEHGY